ncbi:MAG: glucose-6-phosphate dehydrogenase, partial [Pseudomonadota bacterium]
MAKFIPVSPFDIAIFGATGDLAKRKLLPALFHRWLDGQIPENSVIVGSARTEMTPEEFRDHAKEACRESTGDSWSDDAWSSFSERLSYVAMDATDKKANWSELRNRLTG